MLNIFLHLWKSRVISSQEFWDSLKNFYCAVLVVPCFLYLHLNYSINTVTFHHSIYNFFAVTAMFLHMQNNSLFKLRIWRTLFTSFTHMCKHPFWWGCCNYWKKKSSRRDRIPHLKTRVSAVKNISPSQDEIIFKCNQK